MESFAKIELYTGQYILFTHKIAFTAIFEIVYKKIPISLKTCSITKMVFS